MYELLLQVPDGINLTAVLIVCSNSSDLDAIRCVSIEKKSAWNYSGSEMVNQSYYKWCLVLTFPKSNCCRDLKMLRLFLSGER